jgi:hypothetical protein
MKTFHWGHKIGIFIFLFLVTLGCMVHYAMQQTNEMIDANYYQQELAYQQVIDARRNLLNVSDAAILSQNDTSLIVQLPVGTFEHIREGRLVLLRPDNQAKDFQLPLEQSRVSIAKTQLVKGSYTARIHWQNEGKPYYKEETLFIL